MKFGKSLKIVSRKNLLVNQYRMKNISKLKYNPMMEKATQIFTIINYQEKVLNKFVYQ